LRLCVLVASLMRRYPELNRKLELSGISDQELEQIRMEAKARGLLSGYSVPLDQFIASFGEPWERKENLLIYKLELWPDHLYDVGLNGFGATFHKGFRLSTPQFTGRKGSHSPEIRTEHLRVGFHTVHEIELEFGAPYASDSWGATEDWTYRSGNRSVVLSFDFGLLIDVVESSGDIRVHSTASVP
jgi:hypothetical protein